MKKNKKLRRRRKMKKNNNKKKKKNEKKKKKKKKRKKGGDGGARDFGWGVFKNEERLNSFRSDVGASANSLTIARNRRNEAPVQK